MRNSWTILWLLMLGSCTGNQQGGLFAASGAAGSSNDGSPTAVNPATCTPSASLAPLQRLNAAQYTNSVKDLLNLATLPQLSLPTDDSIGPFAVNTLTSVTDLAASQYQSAAETLAPLGVSTLATALPCALAQLDATCVNTFVGTFGARAFRRPLTADEVTRYDGLATSYLAAKDPYGAVRIVVQAMLQSPYFLYRPEFGTGTTTSAGAVPLNSYELATRLSFFLWNSTPDAALQNAAASNLQDANTLQGEVSRLLGSPRFGQSMGVFVQSLLGTAGIASLAKDPNVFPTFSPALLAAMARETQDFTTYVVQQGDGRLTTLMTAPYSVLTDPLFAFYGVSKPANWQAGDMVPLNPNERTGLLTQAAFLAVQAHPNATGVVARGKALRENFLCQAMPPPPPNVPALPSVPAGQETARQMFANHVSSPSCASCHDLMDPMGLAFEHYDGIGAWRDQDNGLTIDTAGQLTGTTSSNAAFADATSLAALLSGSPDVQQCLATQMTRFALQRLETSADACSLARYTQMLTNSKGDVRALAQTIVTSPAFVNLSSP